ncbi:unnamed protein product [Prunus armeniaca]|uniref:Uncharacterized protein n=1 Tax=Prunus armeniaca TaxID=36596 RepID=A0A6J5Y366_PRUAR|nr:unnamed protein product [Prunus armeniaca]
MGMDPVQQFCNLLVSLAQKLSWSCTLPGIKQLMLSKSSTCFPCSPNLCQSSGSQAPFRSEESRCNRCYSGSAETSLQLGSKLLKGLGVMSDDVNFLRQLFRDSMELQAQEGVSKTDDREFNSLKPMQSCRLDDDAVPVPSTSLEGKSWGATREDSSYILTIEGNVDKANPEKQ